MFFMTSHKPTLFLFFSHTMRLLHVFVLAIATSSSWAVVQCDDRSASDPSFTAGIIVMSVILFFLFFALIGWWLVDTYPSAIRDESYSVPPHPHQYAHREPEFYKVSTKPDHYQRSVAKQKQMEQANGGTGGPDGEPRVAREGLRQRGGEEGTITETPEPSTL